MIRIATRPLPDHIAGSNPQRQAVLLRNGGEDINMAKGLRWIQCHRLKYSFVSMSIGHCMDMTALRGPRYHLVRDTTRPLDFAEGPQHKSEICHCAHADV